ncbi:helix-turn-helix domain-containing protein [Actinoplanes oblitus]|uniref:helix-turn-helix domain-containing protein n=1 Tax=Actinoplanes oblitus TaxID=3040509 RepID=UPI003898F7A8
MLLLRRVIGSVLRRVRQHQGRTLKEVAAAAGVSLPYLSEVERGTKEASSEVLAAICRALGLPMTDLLDLVRQEMMRQPAHPVRPAGRYTLASSPAPVARAPHSGPTCSVTGRRPARLPAGRRAGRGHAGTRPRTVLAGIAARLYVTC